MKTRTLSSTAAILLLAVLAILVYLPAKAQQAGEKKPSHYSLTGPDLAFLCSTSTAVRWQCINCDQVFAIAPANSDRNGYCELR